MSGRKLLDPTTYITLQLTVSISDLVEIFLAGLISLGDPEYILDGHVHKKVSDFCALKLGPVHFSDPVLIFYKTLLCHILDHISTAHIHRVRKSNITTNIMFMLFSPLTILTFLKMKRVWLCKDSIRTAQQTLSASTKCFITS